MMARSAIAVDRETRFEVAADDVLNALATTVLVVDAEGQIIWVNSAGEQFFKSSAATLCRQTLHDILPTDSPLFALIKQALTDGIPVTEHGVPLESPRIGWHSVNIQASPLPERPSWLVVALEERTIAEKMDRQMTHRGAARSVTAMASMLAHEVKNPLSGIRGAAQLLEQSVTAEDRDLTRLIRDEVDRICALVDRMEVFSDGRPLQKEAVNIHQVLGRVRQLAENGFGTHIDFTENYDPSLPLVLGNRDQLVQVFLNLVKNAAEAVPPSGGRIILATAYRHGVRFAVPGLDSRVHLPLMISVQDTGEGIPDDLRSDLFNPFVTTKPKGSGLGLALVAKIIGDHGGIIEFDSGASGTTFRVMLPVAPSEESTSEESA